MLTLAIDTSFGLSVAVARDDAVLASASLEDSRSHVEQLMPIVQRLVAEAGIELADVQQVMVGVGPGPFTGLRVGIVTALTLAEVIGVPLRGVCSLDVIARQFVLEGAPSEDFLTVIDARRHELYWARFDGTGRRLDGPHVGPVDSLPALHLVSLPVDAAVLAAAPDAFADAGLEPLYLRDPDAAVATTRKSALNTGKRLSLKRVGS